MGWTKVFDDLEGQVAVITGGARGLGLSMARALAKWRAKIALLDVLADVRTVQKRFSASWTWKAWVWQQTSPMTDKSVTIGSLLPEAASVGPLLAAFDVSSPELVSSEDVIRTVRMQCTSAGMAPPETPAEVTRCILQGLALTYRRTIDLCEQLTDKDVAEVHMIGGGSLNPLLRQLTANACGRPLRFGPVEATSLGGSKA